MKTEQIMRNIFVKELGIEDEVIKSNSTNSELGMDSVDKAMIIVELEKQFDIEISNEEFDELREFNQYVSLVERKIA